MRTTDMDRQASAISAFTDLYRHAVCFQITFSELLAQMDKIRERVEYKRLPQYRRHAVSAVCTFLFHGPADLSIYQHLEYRMLGPDGKYYASFDQWRKLFPEGDAALIETGRHFWKGTDRPY